MWPLVFGLISAAGSAFYLWADWQTSKDIDDSVSQMQQYIDLLSGQMGIQEFLENAWPSLCMIVIVLLAAFIIATPQRKRERRVRL